MNRTGPRLILLAVAAVLFAAGSGMHAQAPRQLPDRDAFFAATRENLLRAEREQSQYAYKERRTDIHVNPFGSKVGTDGSRVYDVTPAPGGGLDRRLIERDGKPVTDSKVERQEPRPQRQATNSGPTPIDDVANVLDLRLDHRDSVDGREAIVVTFAPRPGAKPQTREGRIARNFKGSLWIDEHAHELMRAQAVAIEDLSFGLGLVARLNAGTTATVVREPVDGGVWLPTSVRMIGDGRALLFRKLTVDFVINWFDYRKVR